MKKIIACIDGALHTLVVCDYAIWASQHLNSPVAFLHVLDSHPEQASLVDLSGMIGFDAHDKLLSQLSALDEQRSRLAQLHGKNILEAARKRAQQAGLTAVELRQQHGVLVQSLQDSQFEARLIILGRHEQAKGAHRRYFDHNVERVVRSVDLPVLAVSSVFRPPGRFLIAFDGSETARNMVERLAASALLTGLQCHVLCVSEDAGQAGLQMDWVRSVLTATQFEPIMAVLAGVPERVIVDYILSRGIDLLVMGAYGHSRIRELIVGSLTTTLLRTSPVPVLVMR
ncbi:universal stress protein [Advenella mimigardefordensis]|uniref:Putative universal stress protein A n=1 Tax=Advenella mimigardefordensis (strain DSM 17166 / LMG 22922 / DPN7) TaxID=1247726 RepID=W0PCQ7_ADVMD|nr:universal stress protein [Advenella mimigardefordensis]AHG64541.1 putative universal stress protein A [Advenella mimigardefordensis DPN7]